MVQGAGFREPQGGVQGIWAHLWKEGMSYSPEQCRTGCLYRPAHGGEGEGVFFSTEGLQYSTGKTPPCSSCCFPRRVRCNSGQHTQVQLCFQFGKTTPDSIEPLLKQATYQINYPLNILASRSGAIISINNEVFPHKEKTFRISIWQNTPFSCLFSLHPI